MRVAFLGLGRMGSLMSRHVLAAGHELVVWNRTPGKAADLVAAGATEARSPAEAVEGAHAAVGPVRRRRRTARRRPRQGVHLLHERR